METRLAHAQRQVLSALALVAVVVAALVAGAGPARGDDPQSGADYTPTGIGQLFQAPDAAEGQDPTLYETYPDSSYTFTYESLGIMHPIQDAIDGIFNGLSNLTFMGTRAVTQGSIALTWQATDLTAFNQLGGKVSGGVESVAGFFGGWLLPSTLVLGAAVILFKARTRTGEAINQFGVMVLAGGAVFALSANAGPLLTSLVGVHDVGAQGATAIMGSTSTDLSVPFEGPTPTYGDDDTTNAMRRMGDSIWRTYVATPWCYGEFGTLAACQRWGEEVLAKGQSTEDGKDPQLDYITTQIKDQIGGDKSLAYKTLTGHNGTHRLGIAMLSLVCAIAFAGLALVIALTSLISMMMVFLLVIMSGLFLSLAPIPGRPRQWTLNWIGAVLAAYLLTIGALLALAGALAIMSATIALTTNLGWGAMVVFTIAAIIAGARSLRVLQGIFEASSAGGGDLLARMANIRRLMPRRRRSPRRPKKKDPPHAPTPPQRDTGGRPEVETHPLPRYSQYVRRTPAAPTTYGTDVARPRRADMMRRGPYTGAWRYNDRQIGQRAPAGNLPPGAPQPVRTAPRQPAPAPAPQAPQPAPQPPTVERPAPARSFPQSSRPRTSAGDPRLRDNPPPTRRPQVIDIDPKDVRIVSE